VGNIMILLVSYEKEKLAIFLAGVAELEMVIL
jgi:hypothetical protein